METLFTERQAIEIAFKNLEEEKKQRRSELREDLQVIEDRQFFVLERLAAIDQLDNNAAGTIFMELEKLKDELKRKPDPEIKQDPPLKQDPGPDPESKQDPRSENLLDKQTISVNRYQAKPAAAPLREKTARTKITSPSKKERKPNQPGTPDETGVRMLTEILEAAGEPLNATEIEKRIATVFNKTYSNIHHQVKRWMALTDGKIIKTGRLYSIGTK